METSERISSQEETETTRSSKPSSGSEEQDRLDRRKRLEEELEARGGKPRIIELPGWKPKEPKTTRSEEESDRVFRDGPCRHALNLVYGERNRQYGEPLEDLGRTAKLWSAILGVEVTAEQVALCMIALKISRLCYAYQPDSTNDLAGYAEVLHRIVEERKRRRVEEHDVQD